MAAADALIDGLDNDALREAHVHNRAVVARLARGGGGGGDVDFDRSLHDWTVRMKRLPYFPSNLSFTYLAGGVRFLTNAVHTARSVPGFSATLREEHWAPLSRRLLGLFGQINVTDTLMQMLHLPLWWATSSPEGDVGWTIALMVIND
jgi:hypothetical protein